MKKVIFLLCFVHINCFAKTVGFSYDFGEENYYFSTLRVEGEINNKSDIYGKVGITDSDYEPLLIDLELAGEFYWYDWLTTRVGALRYIRNDNTSSTGAVLGVDFNLLDLLKNGLDTVIYIEPYFIYYTDQSEQIDADLDHSFYQAHLGVGIYQNIFESLSFDVSYAIDYYNKTIFDVSRPLKAVVATLSKRTLSFQMDWNTFDWLMLSGSFSRGQSEVDNAYFSTVGLGTTFWVGEAWSFGVSSSANMSEDSGISNRMFGFSLEHQW